MKPTIPEVLEEFVAYYESHPCWGDLHIVLDDGNVDDHCVQWCLDNAEDDWGRELAAILLRMSPAQRAKLPSAVKKASREPDE